MERRSWYPESPEACLQLADVIVVVHFAVVLFVVLGQIAILLGGWRGWDWVRRPGFRLSHLGLILFVAGQGAVGRLCPLTVWEDELRALAGQPLERASFIAYWSHELLFVEASLEVLAGIYVAFALLVLGSLFLVRIRWRRPLVESGA